MNDREKKLRTLLEKSPDDGFLLYALAMELKKSDTAGAIELLKRTILVEPSQCYAYFQLGQTHELSGDVEAAKSAYRQGIAAAQQYGDAHAGQEISGALEMIEG